jgi:hypothetical protein
MPYICELCNKNYKSYQSLWNHNKKFHTSKSIESPLSPLKTSESPSKSFESIIVSDKIYKCKYCNKIYNNKNSKWSHQNKCKSITEANLQDENVNLKNKVEIFEKEMELMKKQLLTLMNKSCKIHPKTFNKINKQINNNNYINIIQLGNESISDLFSQNQQIGILKYRHQCLSKLIKEVHFNDKYPQFKNILITNTQNNIAYKYDNKENNFVAIDKKELLDDIISERMGDIETFYDNQLDFLDNKTKEVIKFFINKMEDENSEYYENRVKEIKLLIYNNRNKVSKDLEIIL